MAYKSSTPDRSSVLRRPSPTEVSHGTSGVTRRPARSTIGSMFRQATGFTNGSFRIARPGGGFRHSESFRTVFGADEVLYVLMGTMVMANPETGEVHLVKEGRVDLLPEGHLGITPWAWGDEELRVLEYFAPPPSTGTSGAYAQARTYVDQSRYQRTELIGRWPERLAEAAAQATMKVLREKDRLWSLDVSDPRVLTGIIASTDQLTAGTVRLNAGGRSSTQTRWCRGSLCT